MDVVIHVVPQCSGEIALCVDAVVRRCVDGSAAVDLGIRARRGGKSNRRRHEHQRSQA